MGLADRSERGAKADRFEASGTTGPTWESLAAVSAAAKESTHKTSKLAGRGEEPRGTERAIDGQEEPRGAGGP